MIILVKADADSVRGLTKRGYALAPRPLADGTFALGAEVINDPQHAVHSTFLKTLPTRAVGDAEWEVDPAKTDQYDYKTTWPPGGKIVIAAAVKIA